MEFIYKYNQARLWNCVIFNKLISYI
jgi:hypothetical protein